uniref:Coatomer subunit epsilon n=1 Tax=Myxobolus squamalis TaxID=59785 RepID=A0A6B2G3Q3_MYXSQ
MASKSLSVARRNFYVGNYSECIACAKKVDNSDQSIYVQSQIFLYRSLIAKGSVQPTIRDLESNNTQEELNCVKIFGKFLMNILNEEEAVEKLKDLRNSCQFYPELSKILISLIYIQQRKYNLALSCVDKSDDLECLSIYTYALLLLNQTDLALGKVEKMQKIDEDSIITQLTICFTYLRCHYRLKEAKKILDEICQSVAQTPILLSLMAVYNMNRLKWTKADDLIESALEMDPLNQNLLFNSCTVHMYKGISHDSLHSRFKSAYNHNPDHIISRQFDEKSREFDELCTNFSPAI